MGFLKKLTRPLSKFLDKIVPNELKPALPYLSAFAPFIPGMQGIMGSSMLQRALMSGGLNIGSQLAQEGSEGEFSGLSALLAAGTGALSAPGTPATPGVPDMIGAPASGGAEQFFRDKAGGMDAGWMKSGTEMLGKGAEYLTGVGETLGTEPFSVEGLKAATLPLSHGTADLSMAVARKADRDYQRQMEEEESQNLINDEGRRRAIRSAMEAGGHAEEAILDALASLGLREGGIVSLRDGGQLVKRGPGRPGYAGDSRWDDPTMSPGTRQDYTPGQGHRDTYVAPTSTGPSVDDIKIIQEKIKEVPTKVISNQIEDLMKMGKVPNYGINTLDDENIELASVTDNFGDYLGQFGLSANDMQIHTPESPLYYPTYQSSFTQQSKDGGRIGLLRGGDPDDYPQQQDVGTFELQQEEGVPIGPMVQEDKQRQLLKAFAEYQAGGGKLSLKQFAAMWMRENAAGGGRIGFDNGGDMSQWKIGDWRPLKYTGAIDDMWESEEMGDDPLSVIVKMGLTVRAPLIDVIRNVAKTSAEAAKLIAAAGKMGWDLTKSARELVGDIGEGGFEGIKWAMGKGDKWRYAQPNYWITRKAPTLYGKRSLTDDETRLSMEEGKVGREDKDLIKELETKLFTDKIGYGSDYQGGEVELYPGQKYKYAEGGVASVLPRGTEADYRGGGVIPVGSRERADDVPARLSKNEFVMTADAVKAAGGGSVNRGAKKMYNLMHNLEARV